MDYLRFFIGMLLIGIAFFGYFACLVLQFNVSTAFLPVVTVSIITCLVFLGGILHALSWSVWIALGIGLVLATYYGWLIIQKQYSWKWIYSPSIVFFVLFSFVSLFLMRGKLLLHYDNFSHWGIMVKEMFYFDQYPDSSSIVLSLFRNYPPGTATFIYFIGKIIGYTESHALMAQSIFFLSALSCLFCEAWRKIIHHVTICIGCLFIVVFLRLDDGTLSFYNLLVDSVLAVFVLAALKAIFFYQKDIIKQTIVLTPIFSMLVLIKDSGKVFFVLLLFVMFGMWIKKCIQKKLHKISYLPLICALLMISVPLAGSQLWKSHVIDAYRDQKFEDNKFAVSSGSIKEEWNNKSREFKTTLHRKMIKAVLIPFDQNTQMMVFLHLFLLLLFGFGWICYHQKSWLLIKALGLADVFLAIYLLCLYVMYMFIMPEAEAMILAGFERYWATGVIIALGGLVAVVAKVLQDQFSLKGKTFMAGGAVIMLLFGGGYMLRGNLLQLVKPIQLQETRRYDLYQARQNIGGIIDRDQKIIYYNGQSRDYVYFAVRYEFETNTANNPSTEELLNQDKFTQLFTKYDYVVIGKHDREFWQCMAQNQVEVQGEKRGQLYQIHREQGKFRLTAVSS